MLKNIFVLKKDKVKGDWREVDDQEVHDLCFAQNIICVTIVMEDETDGEMGMQEEVKCVQGFSEKT